VEFDGIYGTVTWGDLHQKGV